MPIDKRVDVPEGSAALRRSSRQYRTGNQASPLNSIPSNVKQATLGWHDRSAAHRLRTDPSSNDLSFEPDPLVGPVAEGLVVRASAAAEPRLRAAPALEPAAGDEREVPGDLERAVLHRFDFELAAFGLQALARFAHGTGILELGGLVAVVAEGLPLRLAAAAQRGAKAHSGHVRARALDREIAAREERSVIARLDRVARRGLLDPASVLDLIDERAARTALAHLDDLGHGGKVRLAPWLAPADE